MNSLFWVMGMVGGKLLLDVPEVALILGISKGTVYNRISAGTFQIPMRKEGAQCFADARDVAAQIDKWRERAGLDHEAFQARMNSTRIGGRN